MSERLSQVNGRTAASSAADASGKETASRRDFHKCCSASHPDTASISGRVLSVKTCPAALDGC